MVRSFDREYGWVRLKPDRQITNEAVVVDAGMARSEQDHSQE